MARLIAHVISKALDDYYQTCAIPKPPTRERKTPKRIQVRRNPCHGMRTE